jgi:hypothetical protein
MNNEKEAAGRGGERVREVREGRARAKRGAKSGGLGAERRTGPPLFDQAERAPANPPPPNNPQVLELVMGGVIHIVETYGGDVLRVAGDAIIAVFHGGKKRHVTEADLADCCCRCAFECISLLERRELIEKVGRKLVLHVGISSGPLDGYHVGNLQGDFQCVVTGDAFDDVGEALVLAQPGEVIVHHRTASLLDAKNWSITSPPPPADGAAVPYDPANYRRILLTSTMQKMLLKRTLSGLNSIPPPLERQAELRPWHDKTYTSTMVRAMMRYTPLPVRSNARVERAGMLGEIRVSARAGGASSFITSLSSCRSRSFSLSLSPPPPH